MFNIDTLPMDLNDIILIRYNKNNYNIDETLQLFKYIQNCFSNNKVLFIPDDFISSISIIK